MGNTVTLAHTPPPSAPAHKLPHEEEEEQHVTNNQEFTCEICMELTLIPDKKFKNNNKCAHLFCTDCVIKYIRVKLEDDNAGHIKCPALSCDHSLDPLACASLIGPSLFLRWCDVLCEAAIMGLDKCYCPYTNCNVLILNESGGNLRKSKCPNCSKLFCFQCKKVWHAGFGCEESDELRDKNDVAFGRLVEQKQWMRCPLCRHFVELVEGCRIVKCRCGISFCYKCGMQVHQHWCHCDNTSICCMWFFIISLILIFLMFAAFGSSLRAKFELHISLRINDKFTKIPPT